MWKNYNRTKKKIRKKQKKKIMEIPLTGMKKNTTVQKILEIIIFSEETQEKIEEAQQNLEEGFSINETLNHKMTGNIDKRMD